MPTLEELLQREPPLPKNIKPFTHLEAEEPAFEMPQGAINAHCHVISDGSAAFPYSNDTKYVPAYAPWETLEKLDAKLDFAGEVLVAATCHGTDNDYMVDALRKSDGRAKGVAFVDKDISDEKLKELDAAGVCGVRYSYVRRLVKEVPGPQDMVKMAERLKHLKLKHKWHIDLYCEPADMFGANKIEGLEDAIKTIDKKGVDLVFDHMAIPNAVKKVDNKIVYDVNGNPTPNPEGINDPAFQEYLQLFRECPHLYAKLTCPERITGTDNPEHWKYALPFAQALVKEFPDRVLSGTDWPHPNMREKTDKIPTNQMPNDGKLVNNWIWEVVGKDKALLKKILVDTPVRFFQFDMEKLMEPREKPSPRRQGGRDF